MRFIIVLTFSLFSFATISAQEISNELIIKNKIKSVTINDNSTRSKQIFTYNRQGQLISKQIPVNFPETIEKTCFYYDSNNKLQKTYDTLYVGSNKPEYSNISEYSYDEVGRLKDIYKQTQYGGESIIHYFYLIWDVSLNPTSWQKRIYSRDSIKIMGIKNSSTYTYKDKGIFFLDEYNIESGNDIFNPEISYHFYPSMTAPNEKYKFGNDKTEYSFFTHDSEKIKITYSVALNKDFLNEIKDNDNFNQEPFSQLFVEEYSGKSSTDNFNTGAINSLTENSQIKGKLNIG